MPVGRLIDRGYGRAVMTAARSLAAVLLVALVPGRRLLAVPVASGSALGHRHERGAVRAGLRGPGAQAGLPGPARITVMTLLGGFASTVFIPLTHLLIEALAGAAASGACRVQPLHLRGLACGDHPEDRRSAGAAPGVAPPRTRTPAGSSASRPSGASWPFVFQGIISTGLPIHLIPLLVERGFTLESAVAAYTIIGPAQVARGCNRFGERGASVLRALGVVTMAIEHLGARLLPFVPAGPGC